MRPKIEILTDDLTERILDEAYQLLKKPGIKVQSVEARYLLNEAGSHVDVENEVVRIPKDIVEKALTTVPHSFSLYDRHGHEKIRYKDDNVHFDPGSSGVHILDPETFEHKPSTTDDLVRLVKVAEMLPQYNSQSTAVVCNDVPKQIGDLYRLLIVLLYSEKPIVTGSFAIATLQNMIDMLAIFAGGREALAHKPQAIFDVCPSPPLIWSEFGSQNLIDLARTGIPAQIISMPLAGVASPVTILGSVVQHAAETLSGITIHQLANPGSPVVWGGAPAIFDMRKGTTPMGAIETAMIDIAYAQIGKYLGLPTHAYLGATDAKIVDAQAGIESGITTILGALAGINMISGAGMLDFLACQSAEKLVIDAEAIAMAQRLVDGIHEQTETLATSMFEGIVFKGDFLKQKITRQLFAKEQYLPSPVIDRDTLRGWHDSGAMDTFTRAKKRVGDLLEQYTLPKISHEQVQALLYMVTQLAKGAGMEKLPVLKEYS